MISLESLVEQDYGIVNNGDRWARSEQHSSLVVDKEKQLFYYNTEGIYGDIFIYLTKVRKYSNERAREFIKGNGGKATFIHEVRNEDEVVVYPKLVEIFHENLMGEDKSYFYRRGISDESINRFNLGFFPEGSFYTIPTYVDGVFKQFQLRKDNPKTIKQYYKGVGPLPFNFDILRFTHKVYLVEAPTSAIVLNQNGLPAVSTFGGSSCFLPEWFRYFLYQKEVCIVYDNDDAGRHGAKKVAKILGENKCKIYCFEGHDIKGFDAGDYFAYGGNKEEFVELVNKESKYVFEL